MRATVTRFWWWIVVVAVVVSCQAPAATVSPFGGTWWVSAVNGIPFDHSGAPEVQFTVGGEIRGSSGCHDFSAPVRVDGARITVGVAVAEPADWVCPKQLQDVEAAFLSALREVSTFTGGRPGCDLVLDGAAGTITMESTGIKGTANDCPSWAERHGSAP